MTANWKKQKRYGRETTCFIMRGMKHRLHWSDLFRPPPLIPKRITPPPIGSKSRRRRLQGHVDINRHWRGVDQLDGTETPGVTPNFVSRNNQQRQIIFDIHGNPFAGNAPDIENRPGAFTYTGDPTMSHYLKILMDAIFGRQQFRNEVIWAYRRWTAGTKHFQRMHDTIFTVHSDRQIFVFNLQYETLRRLDQERLRTYWSRRQKMEMAHSKGEPLQSIFRRWKTKAWN